MTDATHFSTTTTASTGGFWARLLDRLVSARKAQLGFDRRQAEIRSLESKTDAELATLGIARNDIARHVFRDLAYW